MTVFLIKYGSVIAGSSNGRTPDSESGNLGSNPSPAAKCFKTGALIFLRR